MLPNSAFSQTTGYEILKDTILIPLIKKNSAVYKNFTLQIHVESTFDDSNSRGP